MALGPSLESISFDTTGLTFHRDEPGRRIWSDDAGDTITLNFFDVPPNLPSGMKTIEHLRGAYATVLADSAARIVEISLVSAASCAGVRLVVSVPQQPSGRVYLGSVTIPFRDFSFVIKAQCAEQGMTGVKEAILFDRMLGAGVIRMSDEGKIEGPWAPDSPQYDEEFPWHPLSRLRRFLHRVQETCVAAPEVLRCPRFPLPDGHTE